jgi:hypothetical protein
MNSKVAKNTFFSQDRQHVVLLNCFSIERILKQKLLGSLIFWNQRKNFQQDKSFQFISEKIPLYRLKHYTNVVYRCGVAFALAKDKLLSPVQIAEELANLLLAMQEEVSDGSFSLALTIAVVEPGWIEWHLDDRQLAIWLEGLVLKRELIREESDRDNILSQKQTINVFPLQYACARCRSLLRLAHERNLIQISDLSYTQPIQQWLEPLPIPWLDRLNNFQLVLPAERDLIDRIIKAIDALESLSDIDWGKVALNLSLAFFNLDRNCRIFGQVERETPDLSIARLGLIAIAQFLLLEILSKKLGVQAIEEL